MKSIIKRLTPNFLLVIKRWVKDTYSLLICNIYDCNRFVKYSSTYSSLSEDRMLGKLILYYHVIEKGLSFENRRVGFGVSVLENLIDTTNEYIDLSYDVNQLQFKTACSVLIKYFEANETAEGNINDLRNKLHKDIYKYSQSNLGGMQTVTKKAILGSVDLDFKTFFNSRHSIREFSDEVVDSAIVLQAVDIAKKYPSVCNRQAIRTYLITNKDKVLEHLSYQSGNRGFGEKIDKVIIVTADLGPFSKAEERNQPFVDGGIYLMGLLLSLHSVGLGAVALNWSTGKKSDLAYRKLGIIKDSEVIISFVGVGHLKDVMTIPKSERNPIVNTLTVID
jgi:nitroreductase